VVTRRRDSAARRVDLTGRPPNASRSNVAGPRWAPRRRMPESMRSRWPSRPSRQGDRRRLAQVPICRASRPRGGACTHRSAAVAIGDGFDCGRLRMPRSDRADLAVAAITLVRVEVVEPRLASVPRCA